MANKTNTNLQKQETPNQAKVNTTAAPAKTKPQVSAQVSLKPKLKPKPKKKRSKPKFFSNTILVGIVNVVILVLLILILGMLPKKATELKRLRNLSLSSKAKSNVEIADLEIKSNIEKSDELKILFPDESGLVSFVEEIEKLKATGVAKKFSFANEDAVRDKTKSLGIPFIVEFEGTWEQIDKDLQALQKLPFLLRVITIETRQTKGDEDTNLIRFMYGGFIYVDESLAKN